MILEMENFPVSMQSIRIRSKDGQGSGGRDGRDDDVVSASNCGCFGAWVLGIAGCGREHGDWGMRWVEERVGRYDWAVTG